MAKYNTKRAQTGKRQTSTTNYAGGEAFTQTPKLEFVSLLLTSFVRDQFYRSEKDVVFKIFQLMQGITDKKFLAKAAIFARNEFGMRSVSHIAAALIANSVKAEGWTKNFFNRVVHRVDDITEILAFYLATFGKPIPNSLKKGLGLAFGKFDRYQLAKYRGEGKAVSLVDAVNLIRPRPTEKNGQALHDLVAGTLRSENTWEAKLTEAGQVGQTEEEVAELKKEAWTSLIRERKIGYFALLRNLRNVVEQAPEVIEDACALLTDERMIRKSLVLPFRFATAAEEISGVSGTQRVIRAVNEALEISLSNVPTLPGTTLVAFDRSGSMTGKPEKIGSLFAAVLAKTSDCDIMVFDDSAEFRNVNTADSVLSIARRLLEGKGGGTDFHCIFQKARKKYDRIVILSDMQGWVGYNAPTSSLANYSQRTGANPHIYSFDLQGYGTFQFPAERVYALAGFSDKVFDIMKLLEQDRDALVHKIEAVEL